MLIWKQELRERLAAAAQAAGLAVTADAVVVERARDAAHGDYASNLAMAQAKQARCKPRELAEKITAAFDGGPWFAPPTIAGPGFINLALAPAAWPQLVAGMLAAGAAYGRSAGGAGRKAMVEYVSANPTGPLHIGHGRGAAYGDALARLLAATGWSVTREFYLNDTGNQLGMLAESLWVRYRQAQGVAIELPENGYHGEYLVELAAAARRELGDGYTEYNDATRTAFGDFGKRVLLVEITGDLERFQVGFDVWSSERELYRSGAVEAVVAQLQAAGALAEQDGALWLKSSAHGDEKDRVLRRADGRYTYLAADIAYHAQKFARVFDCMIDIWGYDHHGYTARVRSALRYLGLDDGKLEIQLYQLVKLLDNGHEVRMGKRTGSFVTLRQVTDEVSTDVARWFFLMRQHESHLDFDLALAKQQSNDNPVYYVQYAHARLCGILRQAGAAGAGEATAAELALLTEPAERALLLQLARFPEEVADAAQALEPQRLTAYLHALTADFHRFYDACHVLNVAPDLMRARLALCRAARQTYANGLALLGISAPESM